MNEQIFASLCLDFSLLILALKSMIAQGVATLAVVPGTGHIVSTLWEVLNCLILSVVT